MPRFSKEPLTGCEANIIGRGDKAIITINSKSIPGRQRFSAGHELGHWMRRAELSLRRQAVSLDDWLTHRRSERYGKRQWLKPCGS